MWANRTASVRSKYGVGPKQATVPRASASQHASASLPQFYCTTATGKADIAVASFFYEVPVVFNSLASERQRSK